MLQQNVAQHSPIVKNDWYQTNSLVYISIFVKNVIEDSLNVNFNENEVTASFVTATQQFPAIVYHLAHQIIPNECTYKVTSIKIEIKLKKKDPILWSHLELIVGTEDQKNQNLIPSTSTQTRNVRNWDQVAKEIEAQDTDKPVDDEAITNLFRDIYGKSDDEVKKAMNKSFVESGGTVLSTNWREVSRKPVDMKPPDGVEFKKWNA